MDKRELDDIRDRARLALVGQPGSTPQRVLEASPGLKASARDVLRLIELLESEGRVVPHVRVGARHVCNDCDQDIKPDNSCGCELSNSKSTQLMVKALEAAGLPLTLDEKCCRIIGGTARFEHGGIASFEQAFVIEWGVSGSFAVHVAATRGFADFERTVPDAEAAVEAVLSVYQSRGLLPSMASLLRAVEALDSGAPRLGPGSTAELLDENEPEGTVMVRDAKGNPRLLMPRSVWDDLRAMKPGKGV